jgi:hypothetical protein
LGATTEVQKIVIQNGWCNDMNDVQNQCLCRLSNATVMIQQLSYHPVPLETPEKLLWNNNFAPTQQPTKTQLM